MSGWGRKVHNAYGRPHRREREQLLALHPWCAYCGAVATVADHRPPLSAYPPGMWRGVLVPSCQRCSNDQGGRIATQLSQATRGRQLPRPSRRW